VTALHLATLPPPAAGVTGHRWHRPLLGRRDTRSRCDLGSICAEPFKIPPAAMAARRHKLTWVTIFALPLFGLALGITVAALIAPELNYLDAAIGAAHLLVSAALSLGYVMPGFLLPANSDSVVRFIRRRRQVHAAPAKTTIFSPHLKPSTKDKTSWPNQ